MKELFKQLLLYSFNNMKLQSLRKFKGFVKYHISRTFKCSTSFGTKNTHKVEEFGGRSFSRKDEDQ